MIDAYKRDPYNSTERWNKWINNKPKIKGTLKYNSDLIIQFLKDFELGKNTAKDSRKGERSPIRLNALKSRLSFFATHFKEKKLDKITKEDIHKLFKDMKDGVIKKANGKNYTSTSSYVKDWKTFWNWYMKVKRQDYYNLPKSARYKIKEEDYIPKNINEDLSRDDNKPTWVYLNEKQFKTLANQCNADYKPLVIFLLDAGCRVTEGYSIKVSDFQEDFTKVTIRAETSKNGYERTINLKLSSNLIKEYVSFYNLSNDSFLFQKKPQAFNKYLKEKCIKIFGRGVSNPKSKGNFENFSLYDIRHIASTYWLQRYATHSGLMYRMGWTSEKFVKYYSEFLGQNDKLEDSDMLIQEDKTKLVKLESELEKLKAKSKDIDSVFESIDRISKNQEEVDRKLSLLTSNKEWMKIFHQLRKNELKKLFEKFRELNNEQ